MRTTTIVVLALAIILGIIAVAGVRGLLIANRSVQPVEVAAPQIETTVVVARAPLEFGTELQPELLREIPWASTDVPEGSFTSISEILNGERRVALRSIAPGELILKDRISGFGGRATLSQIIEKGKRAVTLRINDVSGAGGFILPGDRVDVLSTIAPTGDRLETKTNILLEDVRVLAIDQIASESQEGAVVAKAATLEVEPEDAQKIALASTIGQLSLTLRNLLSSTEEAEEDDGENLNRTISYRDLQPNRPQAAPTASGYSPYTSMRVVRGTSASSASVLRDNTPRRSQQQQSLNRVQQRSQQELAAAANKLTAPGGE